MTTVSRLRVAWNGSAVTGGGVSTYYSTGTGAALQAAVKEAHLAWVRTVVPPTVQLDIPSSGDTLDVESGELTGVWSGGTSAHIVGIASDAFVAGTGIRLVMSTNGVNQGRRVRGSIYFCPLSSTSFDTSGQPVGSLAAGGAATFETMRTTLTNQWVVVSRPRNGHPGMANSILSVSMPDKVSWLRSRRT